MIMNLLVVLTILATGAVAGILLTVRRSQHIHAEWQAEQERQAEAQELYAAWALIRARQPGVHQPSAFDPRDRIPV
jgi:hypothetical protein